MVGQSVAPGRGWAERASGERLELSGRAEVATAEGEVFVIQTPRVGGYEPAA
jgi:N-methylhydantoinase B/oxoprolinase/acetone carboxylase alpha subunit